MGTRVIAAVSALALGEAAVLIGDSISEELAIVALGVASGVAGYVIARRPAQP